jgi:hypothetical protein
MKSAETAMIFRADDEDSVALLMDFWFQIVKLVKKSMGNPSSQGKTTRSPFQNAPFPSATQR